MDVLKKKSLELFTDQSSSNLYRSDQLQESSATLKIMLTRFVPLMLNVGIR
jgi:hypothetical protein